MKSSYYQVRNNTTRFSEILKYIEISGNKNSLKIEFFYF